jgi:hypothetical protein
MTIFRQLQVGQRFSVAHLKIIFLRVRKATSNGEYPALVNGQHCTLSFQGSYNAVDATTGARWFWEDDQPVDLQKPRRFRIQVTLIHGGIRTGTESGMDCLEAQNAYLVAGNVDSALVKSISAEQL